MKAIQVIILILLLCCSDKKSRNTSVGQRDVYGLEKGLWQYYSDDHKLLEEGEFQNGIRKGVWKYIVPSIDSINWREYHNQGKTIVTNLPDFLQVTLENDSIVVFKHKDTVQLFTLAIGVNYNRGIIGFDNYKEVMLQDLKSRNVKITDSTSYIIESNKGKLLYTSISAAETNGRKFRLFNVVRLHNASELVEVSLRLDSQLYDKGRKVFFSVIPNLFINGQKFIDGRERIAREMIHSY